MWLQGGCGPEDPRPAAHPARTPGGTLRILHEPAEDLDPVLVDDAYEATIANQVYEGLVHVDEHLGIVPGLAHSWVISEDGLRYTFRLRPRVRFHDGTMLDAGAVVASLQRVLVADKPHECLAESYLLGVRGGADFASGRSPVIAGITAVDSLTVEIELEEPLSFFLAVLAMDQTRIVPAASVTGWERLSAAPIGTGAFRYGGRRGDEVVLVRYAEYWGRPALLDSLVFLCRESVDKEEVVGLLTTNTVDVSWIAEEYASLLEDTYGLRLSSAPELAVTFIALQCQTPPLDDVRVRLAIAHCIDREVFLGESFQEVILASGILPPGLPGYLPDSRIVPYDMALAREQAAAAGFTAEHPSPPIEFCMTNEGKFANWVSTELAPRLASIGLPLRVRQTTWSELDELIGGGDAPMFSLVWIADVPDPDGFLYPLFRSGHPSNFFRFTDLAIDERLEVIRRMPAGPERFEAYRELEARILAAAPILPLYHEIVLYAWDPAVRDVEFGPYGFSLIPFAKVWFDQNENPAGFARRDP